MREITRLHGEDAYRSFSRISLNAYPSITATEDQLCDRMTEIQSRDESSSFYGMYDGNTLVAGMRLFDFQMNYHGTIIPAGGVGAVAVDLLQKKKGIAKELINFFLEHYLQQGTSLAMLYPFRPDFYYRMGFGYGTKMNQYEFSPASLPANPFDGQLVYLSDEHKPLFKDFYASYTAEQHGFCLKSDFEIDTLFKAHTEKKSLVGYIREGKLCGYVAFNFKKAHDTNFVKNNMVLKEWLWDSPNSLAGLAHFLRTQADQINRIVFATQDPEFHYLLADVRNSTDNIIPSVYHETNTAGVGLMYRIIDLDSFVRETSYRNFDDMNYDLTIELKDTFRPENAGTYALSFADGRASVARGEGVGPCLSIDIADLSALFMGSVSLKSLYNLGRVRLPIEAVPEVDKLFATRQQPQCITAF